MRRGPRRMISRFLKDRRGNYAMMMGFAMLPIMGSLAIAVDFSEMNRQKQATINALDAAGIATARQVVTGASDEALIAYANDFFEANLGSVDPDDTELTVVLPNNQSGGGTLKLTAVLNYQPYFLPAFTSLLGKPDEDAFRDQLCGEERNPPQEHAGSRAGARQFRIDGRIRLRLRPEAHRRCSRPRPSSSSTRWRCRRPRSSRSKSRCSSRWFPSPPRSMSALKTPARRGWTSRVFRRSITRISTGRRCRTPTKTRRKDRRHLVQERHRLGRGRRADAQPVFALPRHEGRHRATSGCAGSKRVVCDKYSWNHTCAEQSQRVLTISIPTGRSRAGRDASKPAPIPTTSTTRRPRAVRPTPASASATRQPCSCRCSRPTSRATTGR